MKEEEILKIIKDICCYSTLSFETNERCILAIQGLLDLYNKQKEKNASLTKQIKLMKSVNINDDFISKDKIRELLKEYEGTGYYELENILKELLEEE